MSVRPRQVPPRVAPSQVNLCWHRDMAALHPLALLTGLLENIVGCGRVRGEEGVKSTGCIVVGWCLGVYAYCLGCVCENVAEYVVVYL